MDGLAEDESCRFRPPKSVQEEDSLLVCSPSLKVHSMKTSGPLTGAPNDNFRKNICSEDDLRSTIFGTFVVKFLAFLLLLGFSNI